ncbi:MAG TPA: response regulator [Gallionella sp.]|nr:response regulator [Gallionella sp.]
MLPPPRTLLIFDPDAARFGLDACPEPFDLAQENPAEAAALVHESVCLNLTPVEDAAAGIHLAREALPDLTFMNIRLPGMDELKASRQLKADPSTRTIPIYALTAFAMQGDEERSRAAGCDGYLSKPVSYKDLLATVGAASRPR